MTTLITLITNIKEVNYNIGMVMFCNAILIEEKEHGSGFSKTITKTIKGVTWGGVVVFCAQVNSNDIMVFHFTNYKDTSLYGFDGIHISIGDKPHPDFIALRDNTMERVAIEAVNEVPCPDCLDRIFLGFSSVGASNVMLALDRILAEISYASVKKELLETSKLEGESAEVLEYEYLLGESELKYELRTIGRTLSDYSSLSVIDYDLVGVLARSAKRRLLRMYSTGNKGVTNGKQD